MSKHSAGSLAVIIALGIAATGCSSKNSPTEPPPACTFSLSASSLAVTAAGGSNSIGVVTAARCSWTAASDRGWMSITGGASGTGPGSVRVDLSANTSESARTGTLTIAGLAVAVVQEGRAPCVIAISPGGASYTKDAATGSFAISTADACPWSAVSSASWLAITSGSPGSGNGTVSYSLERNRDIANRTATIAVGNQTFTVNQAGDPPAVNCEYSVTPVEINACMSVPNQLTAAITTQPGCTWTANSDSSWLTVIGNSSGSGSAIVSFRVTDNWDAPRLGNVLLRWPTPTAGQNVRVRQAGCRYAVSVASFDIAGAGGTGRFDVIQQSDPLECGGATQDRCVWTAQADVPWITVTTSMPQAGDNPVSFSVAANDSTLPRTGRIVVRDKTVVITQAGR